MKTIHLQMSSTSFFLKFLFLLSKNMIFIFLLSKLDKNFKFLFLLLILLWGSCLDFTLGLLSMPGSNAHYMGERILIRLDSVGFSLLPD